MSQAVKASKKNTVLTNEELGLQIAAFLAKQSGQQMPNGSQPSKRADTELLVEEEEQGERVESGATRTWDYHQAFAKVKARGGVLRSATMPGTDFKVPLVEFRDQKDKQKFYVGFGGFNGPTTGDCRKILHAATSIGVPVDRFLQFMLSAESALLSTVAK